MHAVSIAVVRVAFLGQLGTGLTWSVPMLGWSNPTDKHTPGGEEPFYCPMVSAGRSISWSNPGQPPWHRFFILVIKK